MTMSDSTPLCSRHSRACPWRSKQRAVDLEALAETVMIGMAAGQESTPIPSQPKHRMPPATPQPPPPQPPRRRERQQVLASAMVTMMLLLGSIARANAFIPSAHRAAPPLRQGGPAQVTACDACTRSSRRAQPERHGSHHKYCSLTATAHLPPPSPRADAPLLRIGSSPGHYSQRHGRHDRIGHVVQAGKPQVGPVPGARVRTCMDWSLNTQRSPVIQT